MPTYNITKLTPTTNIHPAVGRLFIIELSSGERFETNADQLMSSYCYDYTKPVGHAFDEEKADRLVETNFQELIGESWKSEI